MLQRDEPGDDVLVVADDRLGKHERCVDSVQHDGYGTDQCESGARRRAVQQLQQRGRSLPGGRHLSAQYFKGRWLGVRGRPAEESRRGCEESWPGQVGHLPVLRR